MEKIKSHHHKQPESGQRCPPACACSSAAAATRCCGWRSSSDSAEISVTFVDNEQIRELNAQIPQQGYAARTCLSFPMGENGVYDDQPRHRREDPRRYCASPWKWQWHRRKRYGHSLEREIGYLTAHSMLHLLGYDHENGGMERVRMREKEEYVMSQLGLPGTSSYTV